ncbi:MAG TPA: DegV family protein [Xanthomonadaceae bacterium]|nr:DegV family protein [Xanthomonadaceae bacterium]
MREPVASTPRISAAGLRRALIAGANRVIARREHLNRINVFPVPDGDTGSNLAFTLRTVLAEALARPSRDVSELLGRVGSAAVDGARGNSGAIFAQFLCGVGELVAVHGVVMPGALAGAVRVGADQARGALAQPREGTILSVIDAFADALQTPAADLRSWFEQALARARVALAHTPTQLEVLREAGVVDAGGQGFVDLLEGIGEFIATGRVPRATPAGDDDLSTPLAGLHMDVDPRHRWCTECVIEGDGVDREAIHGALAEMGASSVVLAGGRDRVRVHAHVGDPATMFDALAGLGAIAARKADDMMAQQRATGSREVVGVVTDSGADLPEGLIAANAINVVPVRVNFGAEDFLDKVTLSPAAFYRRMREGGELPLTSQPPPGDFRRMFEFLGSHHPAVVYVGLSRAVSGTLQSAETAAQRSGEADIRVLDSGHASCGQGLIALAVAEAARAGASAGALVALVARLRARTWTWAAARDISHAVRGGRIPRWAAPFARWLAVTPLARIRADGRLGICGALPGRGDVPRRFAAYLVRRLPRGHRWRVLVGHCDCAADGEALRRALVQRLQCEDSWLVEAGPAVGAHAGPGTLVVSVQQRDGSGATANLRG